MKQGRGSVFFLLEKGNKPTTTSLIKKKEKKTPKMDSGQNNGSATLPTTKNNEIGNEMLTKAVENKQSLVIVGMVVALVVLVYSGGMLHESMSKPEDDTKVNWPLFGINALLNLIIVVAIGILGSKWNQLKSKSTGALVLGCLFLGVAFVYVNLGVLAAVMTPNDGFLARSGGLDIVSGILIGVSSLVFIAGVSYLIYARGHVLAK